MKDDLLLWQDFDRKNVDFPEEVPGLERFNENRFERQYTVLKYAHLSSRIITLDKSFQLPFNSILHILDDVNNTDENHSDVPDVNNNELIKRESSRKYVYHVRNINTEGPVEINDKFIFRTPGLPTKLMAFRNEFGSQFRYINSFDQMPKTKEPLLIVNHNPLFRVRLYGRMRFFRKTQIILSSILNTCNELKDHNKHQFIMIPWGTEVYPRTEFIKSHRELTFASIKHPESFHYLLMMHLMNYMWEGATTSIFSKLDDSLLNQITLVLQSKDKYIFMNLGKIKSFNENNRAYIKFSNQLNLLSVLGRDNPEAAAEYLESIQDTNDTVSFTDVKLVPNIKGSPDKSVNDDEHAESIIEKLDAEIPNKINKRITPVSIEVPSKSVTEIDLSKGDAKVEIKKLRGEANISKVEEYSSKEHYAKDWIKTLDSEADAFIDKNELLTPAAKDHFKKVARKYKTCTLDGVSLEELMSREDIALTDSTIDPKILGFIPDKSAAASSLASFDKDYVAKSYKKHLASILTSFQKNGLYLIGVKQEKVVDVLHNYTVYSAQYEDINSVKSTIRFVIPNINSEDRFITDGKPSVLKKQRCPLPIVKISPTTVSLSSNYNKTRVIRNTNKAYHFIDYISSFIDSKAKSTAKIVYGSLKLNEPISYEYTELASRYKHIDLYNQVKYHLTFDYPNRFSEFDKDEKLFIKLEATYGTYFGYTDNNYLFIDTDNRVYAYKKIGGEDVDFVHTSIIDILKLALLPGVTVKKNFSEYVTCQILNGDLPVIFILAYRFGLRSTLDYLGIPYTIVANDSREIVGEAIPATEALPPGMAINPGRWVKNYQITRPYTVEKFKEFDAIRESVVSKIQQKYTKAIPDSKVKQFAIDYLEANCKPSKLILTKKDVESLNKKYNVVGANSSFPLYGLANHYTGACSFGDSTQPLNESMFKEEHVPENEIEYCRSLYGHEVYLIDNLVNWLLDQKRTKHLTLSKEYIEHMLFTTIKHEEAHSAAPKAITEECLRTYTLDAHEIYAEGCAMTALKDWAKDKLGENVVIGTESYIDTMPGANPYGLGWIPNPTKEGGTVSNPTDIHDETDVIIDSDTRGSKYILPQNQNTSADDKISDVKVYVSESDNKFTIEAITMKVKVGMLRTAIRRVSSFSGVIFSTSNNKLPIYLASEIANALRCNSDKVKNAPLISISKGKLPAEVRDAKEEPIQQISVGNVSQESILPGMEAIKDAKYKKKTNDIVIKFADRTLHINRYPLALSLIVAGLIKYDLTPYQLADMEDKDVYFRILAESGDKPNLLKGVDSMFDLFIDPITYQVLKSMHEPTTFRDLLIRATVLLTTTDHKEPSSAANHRIRGYEQLPAILYNEMARQFASYQTKKHQKGNVYSINPQAVYLRVIQNESTMPGEAANPLEDIKIASNLTYSGVGGRDGESFVKSDRKMSADDVGIISEATADSGKVGMNAMLSFDPRIKNTQGLITPCTIDDLKDMQPAECLSIHALMMPFSTSDD